MRTARCTERSCLVVLSLLAAVAALACSPTEVRIGEGALSIQTSQVSYSAGDTVSVRLHNVGTVDVEYSCHVLLERWEGSRWTEYGSRVGFGFKACNAILVLILPDEARDQLLHVPAATEAGTYRFRFDNLSPAVRSGDTLIAAHFRVSNPFAVR